ncbi:hypothetical protein BSKO_01546 [Bryopsis sp. KO-2023]|nr:hypothetical protein BSKO_01546 [Bryopsis sp. KO-2023]
MMVRFQGLCLALLVLSAGCLSFAASVEKDPLREDGELVAGNGRDLKVLGGFLLKKLLVGKAIVAKVLLTKALLVKSKLVFWKLKKAGLARLLRQTGVKNPKDLPIMLDLGKICNVALDMGKSCAKKAAGGSESLQKKLRKMQKVVLEVEGEKEDHYVEYFETEVTHPKDGETEYYILEDDGTKTPYHPAEGDRPVEYVIENEDGSTSPYTGPVEIKSEEYHSEEEGEVKFEVKDHAPDEAIEFLKDGLKKEDAPAESSGDGGEKETKTEDGGEKETKTVEFEHEDGETYSVEVPHEGEYEIELVLPEKVHEEPVQEIAVDTIHEDGKIKYVRYKTQRKSGVKDSKEVVAFKLKMMEMLVKKSDFKKQDEILYTKMLA